MFRGSTFRIDYRVLLILNVVEKRILADLILRCVIIILVFGLNDFTMIFCLFYYCFRFFLCYQIGVFFSFKFPCFKVLLAE